MDCAVCGYSAVGLVCGDISVWENVPEYIQNEITHTKDESKGGIIAK
jgi:hypothetical protein